MSATVGPAPDLGLLAGLAGVWQGGGVNVVAVPDFGGRGNVVVGVNLTADRLSFTPAASSIRNRGYAQPDTEFGALLYVHSSSDAVTGDSIHVEPGIWITQPSTTHPSAEPPRGGQLVARMWSITHGSSFVGEGFALPFSGPPVIGAGVDRTGGGDPAFSSFPSFNSTPLPFAFPDVRSSVFGAGTSAGGSGLGGGFPEYVLAGPRGVEDVAVRADRLSGLPSAVTQELVNDPIILLQRVIEQRLAEGYRFDGVALNISTASGISFGSRVGTSAGGGPPVSTVSVPQFGGGIANHSFLLGADGERPNAVTALVYATFWIEKLSHPDGRPPLLQLQYAQNALVNFPARNIAGEPNMSWPHVTVATLQKTESLKSLG